MRKVYLDKKGLDNSSPFCIHYCHSNFANGSLTNSKAAVKQRQKLH